MVSTLLSGCSQWASFFDGLSNWGAQALGAGASVAVAAGSVLGAPGLGSTGVVLWPTGLVTAACETFPEQGVTLSLLREQAVLHQWATREASMQLFFSFRFFEI